MKLKAGPTKGLSMEEALKFTRESFLTVRAPGKSDHSINVAAAFGQLIRAGEKLQELLPNVKAQVLIMAPQAQGKQPPTGSKNRFWL